MFLLLLLPSFSSSVVVTTGRGAVRGFHLDLGSDRENLFYGHADVFLSIPYALPPIGQRRFKLPKPICQYDEEVDATSFGPRCPQPPDGMDDPMNFTQSEDCLTLSIYSPDVAGKFPVMVWIPGGSLTTGGSDKFGVEGIIRNLVSRDVVVVSLQYRLGLLGFFTTFSSSFPPNRGLFDQLLALRWVQEEIVHFGGDPSRVTAFGESAGAISISALSLSPLSKGLFHHLIQQSGSILTEFETPEEPRWNIHKRRAHQICGTTEEDWSNATGRLTETLLDCFSSRSFDHFTKYDYDGMMWCVGRDGVLIPSSPSALAASRPNLPSIIGDCRDEAAYFSWPLLIERGKCLAVDGFRNGSLDEFTPTLIHESIPQSFPYLNKSMADHLSSLMVDVFTPHGLTDDDRLGWAKATVEAYGGVTFTAFARRDAGWRRGTGNSRLFLYTFDYSSPLCQDWNAGGWRPIKHTDDLCFLFFYARKWKAAERAGTLLASDIAVADNMAKAWTDFAKTGDPGWPAASDDFEFVYIDDTMNRVERLWREDEDILYNRVFTQLLGEFPPVSISREAEERLQKEAAIILSEWTESAFPPSCK